METGVLHTHTLIVTLYVLQLLAKVIMLGMGKHEALDKFSAKTKIPHIVLATLMVATGIFLMIKSPTGTQPYIFVKLGLVLVSIPVGIIGMKRKSMMLATMALLILIGVFAISKIKPEALRSKLSAEINTENTNGADAEMLKSGQTLYEKYCVLCHGADGAAGFQGAKSLAASTLSDDDIKNIIRNGKGVMPANADLSDTEVDQVKAYVKYLRK
jgi:cytochrome c5